MRTPILRPSQPGPTLISQLGLGSASAFQSFLLGAGHPTTVDRWTRSFPMPTKRTGQTLLNPHGRKAWREDGPTGGRDLWEMHGVWEWDGAKEAGVVLLENYFLENPATGRKVRFYPAVSKCKLMAEQVDWYTDFYYPFLKRWTARVRGAVANGRGHEKVFFVEPIPNEVQKLSLMFLPLAHDGSRLVLPTVVDIRSPATQHGVCSPLVGDTFLLSPTSHLKTT